MYGISDAQSCKSTSITVIFTSEVIRTIFFLWFVHLICLTGNMMMPKILNGILWNWADRFPVSLEHVLIILSQQVKAITDTMCMSNCTHTHTHTHMYVMRRGLCCDVWLTLVCVGTASLQLWSMCGMLSTWTFISQSLKDSHCIIDKDVSTDRNIEIWSWTYTGRT